MPQSTGFKSHDHAGCVMTALRVADEACVARGLRMTPVRRRVLEILLEAHTAMGAYDVLDRLAGEGLGDKPPVAYRALAFLVEQGFVHRIERLNAFVACAHPGDAHAPAFLICRGCGSVAEDAAGDVMARSAEAAGFLIEQRVVEIEGLCPECRP